MNKSILAITIASLVSPFSYLHAQEAIADETVVVTANRFEQTKSSSIASADVITKDQIDKLQLKTLTEVLKLMPGVQVSNNGGQGQSSSVFVRGHSSSQIIVLVNGVRFGSSTTGSANFTSIPLTGVEKVELVRGARAAVYGADAIGGVINIVTNAGSEQADSGNVKVGFGSDKYTQGSGSAYSKIGNDSWAKFGFNSESAEGFDATSDGYQPNQPDKDGFSRQDFSVELGHQINQNWSLLANGFYHKSNSEYDGYLDSGTSLMSPDEQDSELYNLSAQLNYSTPRYSSSLVLASNRDKSEQLGGEIPGSTIVTDRLVANWLNTYEVNDNIQILGGLEYLQDSVGESSIYDSYTSQFKKYDAEERNNISGFVTSIAQFGAVSLEASLRHDDNDVYGNFTTWQLGGAYQLNERFRLLASTGTAFRAPTYNDLYWPDYGNPELEPEESIGYEAGFEVFLDTFDLRVVGYHSEIDNLISYQGRGDELESSNATIKGVEIVGNFETGPVAHTVSADFIDTDNLVNVANWNEAPKFESKELSRRANEVFKWLMTYELNQWQADLSYMYQGDRYDDSKNQTKLDAYSVVDLALGYQINEVLKVQAKAVNLLDEEYETVADYNTQGRAYYLNASYEF